MNTFNTFSKNRTVLLVLLGFFLSPLFISAQNQSLDICSGDSAYLTLSGQRGAIQWQESSAGTNWSNIPGATQPTLGVLVVSDMWYRAEVTEGTCLPFWSDTTFIQAVTLIADAGPDVSLCIGGSDTLGGNPSASGGTAPYTYNWAPITGLNNPNASNPLVTPSNSTVYVLTLTDSTGCSAADSVSVDTSGAANPGTQTFAFTGAMQIFVVPPCVDSVHVEVFGAQGGDSQQTGGTASGGLGGNTSAMIAVNTGDTLFVYVGEAGIEEDSILYGGWNGGGGLFSYTSGGVSGTGGGASDVRTSTSINDRIVVSGGGGGSGGYSSNLLYGGGGGILIGQDGQTWPSWPSSQGKGGTQNAGGAGGTAGGGSCAQHTTAGFFWRGGFGSGDAAGGGGGGGGWYGGGGGCFGGGGGGSSYVIPTGRITANARGVRSGNGQVIISW